MPEPGKGPRPARQRQAKLDAKVKIKEQAEHKANTPTALPNMGDRTTGGQNQHLNGDVGLPESKALEDLLKAGPSGGGGAAGDKRGAAALPGREGQNQGAGTEALLDLSSSLPGHDQPFSELGTLWTWARELQLGPLHSPHTHPTPTISTPLASSRPLSSLVQPRWERRAKEPEASVSRLLGCMPAHGAWLACNFSFEDAARRQPHGHGQRIRLRREAKQRKAERERSRRTQRLTLASLPDLRRKAPQQDAHHVPSLRTQELPHPEGHLQQLRVPFPQEAHL
jgi:hypothetical protein